MLLLPNFRLKDKVPLPWSAITTSAGVAVIVLLLGYIFYQALNRIEKVEDDYREMSELKGRAEAAAHPRHGRLLLRSGERPLPRVRTDDPSISEVGQGPRPGGLLRR